MKSQRTRWARDESPGDAERLAAGMDGDDIAPPFVGSGETTSLRPVDPRGMGLVDDEKSVVPVGEADEVGERGEVAVHAVEAFDHDEDLATSARRAPGHNRALDGAGVVMGDFAPFGAASACALMDAGMHQGIEDEEIALLRQRRQDGEIGDIAAAEEKRALGAEKRPRLALPAPRARDNFP